MIEIHSQQPEEENKTGHAHSTDARPGLGGKDRYSIGWRSHVSQ